MKTNDVIKKMSSYNYYAEQMTQFMAQHEIIFDEDVPIMEEFIRGCA